MLMFTQYWKEYLNAAFAAFTMISCILLINGLPAKKWWLQKMLVGVVALGAAGLTAAPFVGDALYPTLYEMLFHAGACAFSVWLTLPFWFEIPCLDRRAGCVRNGLADRRAMFFEDHDVRTNS